MATSDQEQKGINVPQHKRMAMGAPITGQTMQAKEPSRGGKPSGGGLSHVKSKNK